MVLLVCSLEQEYGTIVETVIYFGRNALISNKDSALIIVCVCVCSLCVCVCALCVCV